MDQHHPQHLPSIPGHPQASDRFRERPQSPQQMAPQMPEPAPEPEPQGTEIRLTSPITVSGQEIAAITLRDPNFGDWLDCGELQETILHDVDPSNFQMGANQKVEIRNSPKAAIAWFTRLSGLRAQALKQISMTDFRRIHGALQKLVGEGEPEIQIGDGAPICRRTPGN